MARTSDADARADLEADLDRLIALKCPEVTDPAPYKAEVLRAFDEANRRSIAIYFRMYVEIRVRSSSRLGSFFPLRSFAAWQV
jgi:hypothetical protein